MTPPPSARIAKSITDLVWVVVATLLVFALASRLQWFESYAAWAQRFEHFDADEMVFALATLAVGLAWYAARRWREAREVQQRVVALLADNRELAQRLITVQENERRALARELHDELGQTITALRAEAAAISVSDAAAARIGTLAETLARQVREMLHQLRPAELDSLGLIAAIQTLCEAWETRCGVACVFHHDVGADAFGDAANVAVYRVVQEALSNVMRHARATRVRITLRSSPTTLRLEVQDDGVGLDPAAPRRGLGLLGAAERAAALGGRLSIHSAPGQGLALHVELPVVSP